MFKQTKACLLLLLITSLTASAQDKKEEAKDSSRSYFKAEGNFVNSSVYLGRKDSLTLPYITPSIGYYNKSGVYVSASVAYSTSDKRIDYFSLDAGYEFDISKKLSGSVYGNKTFYNDSSNNVSSNIGGSMGAGLTYDFDVVQFHTGFDLSFASKPDYGVNFSVARSFYLGEDGKQWTVSPSVVANFNTLNFYEDYTSKTAGKKQKKNPLVTSVTSTTTITNKNANTLTLMDYEISIPVSYDTKKWGVYFTPTLAIPQNAIYTSTTSTIKFRNPATPTQTVTTNSTPDSEKKLTSHFYAEVGVYFKF